MQLVTEETRIVKEDYQETYDKIETQEEVVPKKGGLFSKIKSLFTGKVDSETRVTKVKKEATRTVKRDVKKKEKKKKVLSHQLPDFVAESMGVLALGALDLFEIFDTEREGEYRIAGVIESDFKANSTTFLLESILGSSESVISLLDGLDEYMEAVMSHFVGNTIQLRICELLFSTKEGERMLFRMDSNDERMIAIVALTYSKDITEWQLKDKTEKVKRRTLMMRSNQLLSARQHTPLDTSVARILGDNLVANLTTHHLEKAILSIYV